MQLAQEWGVRRLLLETDCQVLVNLWMNRFNQRSEIYALLEKMEVLSRSFDAFSFCFIGRNCNKLAHACARLVSRDNQVAEWLLTPPGLADIRANDCNPIHN